ncbi:MAG: hypothetical protein KKI12_01995 [Proteobacteria bacterium]|nr:hypothetical protein [Pseudomonadota bacterium]MBU4258328.1 hypothetical protein [Pseudomonadota bacterium]MBU4286925.1 hypothetical protein [Pseudomonadota bacterium]MBU4415488.1 hypothetical protein [Pseudomonadota bacterium]MCG2757590.1 hypothetical protein [Desulfobacteraceae bacterium]
MSTGTIISIIIAVVGCILVVFFYMNDSINKRIEITINDPKFIKKVADDIRLPFLIFDEKGTFHSESGEATAYIEKIEPIFEDKRLSGFVVYPKGFLKEAPILQAINNDFRFTLPKKINTYDWKYRIPEFQGTVWADTGKYDEPPAVLFKLEIIR